MEISAHRGWSSDFPENSLAASAAALEGGCDEVEVDVRVTRDGVPVLLHDATLERTHDDPRRVVDVDADDLATLAATGPSGAGHVGLGVTPLSVVLNVIAPHVRLNLHVYDPGARGEVWPVLERHRSELERRGSYVAGDEQVLRAARRDAPWLPRCCLAHQDDPETMIATGVELGCVRVQFGAATYTADTVRTAHARGVRCNLFFADDEASFLAARTAGIDTVLTNTVGAAARWRAAAPR